MVGVHGKPFVRKSWPVGNENNVFLGGGGIETEAGWMTAVIYYKWVRLPFISYNGPIRGYIGWREAGNFGIELRKNSNFGSGQKAN